MYCDNLVSISVHTKGRMSASSSESEFSTIISINVSNGA